MKNYIELDKSLWRLPDDEIVVGCTNFLLLGQRCPTAIRKDGKVYKFASLEFMKPEMAGHFCSCIRYKLTNEVFDEKEVYPL